MPPSVNIDSHTPNDIQQADIINLLIAALDINPNGPPIDGEVPWHKLKVGRTYWGLVTGFGADGAVPRRFTVTNITHYPDNGAMIWTDEPADGVHSISQSSRQWAYGVGASCESVIGPRNRFWTVEIDMQI